MQNTLQWSFCKLVLPHTTRNIFSLSSATILYCISIHTTWFIVYLYGNNTVWINPCICFRSRVCFDMTDLCYTDLIDFMTTFYIQGCTHNRICGMWNKFNSIQFKPLLLLHIVRQVETNECHEMVCKPNHEPWVPPI